jgi:hypothetical protein
MGTTVMKTKFDMLVIANVQHLLLYSDYNENSQFG